jgi:hypothetical protein
MRVQREGDRRNQTQTHTRQAEDKAQLDQAVLQLRAADAVLAGLQVRV